MLALYSMFFAGLLLWCCSCLFCVFVALSDCRSVLFTLYAIILLERYCMGCLFIVGAIQYVLRSVAVCLNLGSACYDEPFLVYVCSVHIALLGDAVLHIFFCFLYYM